MKGRREGKAGRQAGRQTDRQGTCRYKGTIRKRGKKRWWKKRGIEGQTDGKNKQGKEKNVQGTGTRR